MAAGRWPRGSGRWPSTIPAPTSAGDSGGPGGGAPSGGGGGAGAPAGRGVRWGGDWLDVLRAEGLIRAADAAVLDSAQRAGDLAWAFREVAEGAERRLNYRLQALSQALFPAVVLAVGALIGLVVTAYF